MARDHSQNEKSITSYPIKVPLFPLLSFFPAWTFSSLPPPDGFSVVLTSLKNLQRPTPNQPNNKRIVLCLSRILFGGTLCTLLGKSGLFNGYMVVQTLVMGVEFFYSRLLSFFRVSKLVPCICKYIFTLHFALNLNLPVWESVLFKKGFYFHHEYKIYII